MMQTPVPCRRLLAIIGTLTVFAGAVIVLSACATPVASGLELVPSGVPGKAMQTMHGEQLPRAINDFGVNLLSATSASAEQNANVIVSPVSVHAALSMTGNGATGETAAEMRSVLRTDAMTPAEANAQWAALLGGLASRSPDQTLDIANALFAHKEIAFKQPFLDTDRDYFGAQVSSLDFDKDDVPGIINGWVSRNTQGMIPTILDQADASAILYLANAVYFKGDWVSPFEHERTWKQAFSRSDGTQVDVDMMHASQSFPYVENRVLQATKLLYRGFDTSFYVMLPRTGVSLDTALASLKGTGFADLRATMMTSASRELLLGLPKLDTGFGTNLNEPLRALGMPRAFDMTAAEFSGMADLTLALPIFIGRVLHKTKVIVNEMGTEAAAATVVEMLVGSAGTTEEPATIICDRPYLFAIVDEPTGTMLFLGTVGDPTK